MSESDGRVIGSAKVVDNGPDNLRWNLVIVDDGYREGELTDYHNQVQTFIAVLSNTPPFAELFRGINIHRVDVASVESGADDPVTCVGGTGAAPRTFFNATFFCFRNTDEARLLTVDSGLARFVATQRVPLRHQVLCIVNTPKYGGSGIVGGGVATCSVHPQSAEIAIHEMGHTFGLADEYGGTNPAPGFEPPNPNVTLDPRRAMIKWGALVNASTPMPSECASGSLCAASTCVPPATPPLDGAVGAYEGGLSSNCNTYRPVRSCRMRDLSSPFCPVCAGVIRRALRPFQP